MRDFTFYAFLIAGHYQSGVTLQAAVERKKTAYDLSRSETLRPEGNSD